MLDIFAIPIRTKDWYCVLTKEKVPSTDKCYYYECKKTVESDKITESTIPTIDVICGREYEVREYMVCNFESENGKLHLTFKIAFNVDIDIEVRIFI